MITLLGYIILVGMIAALAYELYKWAWREGYHTGKTSDRADEETLWTGPESKPPYYK